MGKILRMAEITIRQNIERMTTIPDTEWEFAKNFVFLRTLSKGGILQMVGAPPEDVGMILAGIMSASFVDGDGKERIKVFGEAGTVMGAYNSHLTGKVSNLSIRAETPTTLFCIKFGDLEKLYVRHSCWQEFGRKAAEQHLLLVERREHELLMLSAPQRYEKFLIDYPRIAEAVPQWKIASYLGITPEALSRIRKQLGIQEQERAEARALPIAFG